MCRFFFYSFLLVTASSCRTVHTASSTALLLDTRWVIEQIDGKAVAEDAPEAYITLQSGEAQTVSGNTGCNAISGTFRVADGGLTFSGVAMTRRACLNANIESEFTGVLSRTAAYRISGGKLILTDGKNDIAVFKK